jgi:hypothetical protein
MTSLPRVLVHTNVLFPFSVMDLMLALTEDGIHTLIWNDALLKEWERVIVHSGRCSVSSAAAVTGAVRKFFPEYADPAPAGASCPQPSTTKMGGWCRVPVRGLTPACDAVPRRGEERTLGPAREGRSTSSVHSCAAGPGTPAF